MPEIVDPNPSSGSNANDIASKDTISNQDPDGSHHSQVSHYLNPYIVGSPVAGSEMFFGREDVFEFIRKTLVGQHRDNVIILYGQFRTGKTSVLRQMHSRLKDERYLCIFMDLQSFVLKGLDGFLWELANNILRGLRRYNYRKELPSLKHNEFMIEPPLFDGFLNEVRSCIEDRHILLMLDEVGHLQGRVQKGHLGAEIFGYMRYLMQNYEWLNFLFSLGRGMEEMGKEYAFLFNVGLYKKISFLDRDATKNLITQPVYYHVEPAAVERIFYITSGHPYYTQLLCHCLFNFWKRQEKQIKCIIVENVDKILNEAMGLGFAVLKDAWGRLTPGEQAIVAGMAAAMDDVNCAVDLKDINQAWERCGIIIPQDKMVQAIRSLIACDVIVGQDAYTFTVDLQRLWVQKYQSIELVKEEIKDFLEPPKSIPLSWSPSPSIVRLVMVVMTLLLIGGSSGLFYGNYYIPNLQHASATATAQAISIANVNATIRAAVATLENPYPPHQGTLALDDPLYDNSHGYNWDQRSGNDCQFPGDGYHVATAVKSSPLWCAALATNFSNFVYQAQMTIAKGDGGGLIFRADADNSKLYDFSVDKNGYFYLLIYTDINTYAVLQAGPIPSFHKGLGQSNLIAIKAQDDHITLYANLKYVTEVTDANLSQGQIGVEATEADNSTEVIFTDAKVWKL